MAKDLIFDELDYQAKKHNKYIDENGIWQYFYPNASYVLGKYGFKIHISGTICNAKEILNVVLPILFDVDVLFKICKTFSDLSLLNTGYYGNSQIGKLCTIYPRTEEELIQLLDILYKKTKIYNSIEIPSDFRYKNSSIVYYRYGELDLNTGMDPLKIDFVDQRQKMIPDYINVPILDFYIQRRNKINLYHPIKCFRARGKSTVHLAVEKSRKDFCVIKRGYYLGEINLNSEDGMDKVNNEYNILSALSEENIFPKIYDIFYSENSLFLIEEFVKGKVLSELLCEVNHSLKEEFFIILEYIRLLHGKGYIINDLSPDNIIIDLEDNCVRFIDAEQVCLMGEFKEHMKIMGTPGFTCGEYSVEDKDIYSFLCIIFCCKNRDYYINRQNASVNFNELYDNSLLEKHRIKELDALLGESERDFFKRDYQQKIKILEKLVFEL